LNDARPRPGAGVFVWAAPRRAAAIVAANRDRIAAVAPELLGCGSLKRREVEELLGGAPRPGGGAIRREFSHWDRRFYS
jgi:hypothetical protein